jgi:hypothetical protein
LRGVSRFSFSVFRFPFKPQLAIAHWFLGKERFTDAHRRRGFLAFRFPFSNLFFDFEVPVAREGLEYPVCGLQPNEKIDPRLARMDADPKP